MTALRRTEADLWSLGGFWPGLLPLLFCAVGLLLWTSQFQGMPALADYVRGDYGPCSHSWREPGWLTGDPHFEHLMLVSDCQLDLTAFRPRDQVLMWGWGVAFVTRPKTRTPGADRGYTLAALRTPSRPKAGKPLYSLVARARTPTDSRWIVPYR